MTRLQDTKTAGAQQAGGNSSAAIQQFDARSLLGTEGLAEIMLGEQRYLLRLTKAGKLILTK